MNSSFRVSDVSAHSPLDVGAPSVQRVAPPAPTGAQRRKDALGANAAAAAHRDNFQIYVEPKVRHPLEGFAYRSIAVPV